jgi:hypothetical protein
VKARERRRKKYGLKKRYFNTLSYQLEASAKTAPGCESKRDLGAPKLNG